MAARGCYDCVYVRVDPDGWLRELAAGRPVLPWCANHPQWPGQLREVPGTACGNFRSRFSEPVSEVKRIPRSDGRSRWPARGLLRCALLRGWAGQRHRGCRGPDRQE